MLQDLQIGSLVNDKYRLIEVIASGSTSTIYKAEHELLPARRIVALKVLKPGEDFVAIQRFQGEALAASRMNHRNVGALYDFGILPSGLPFLTMEFCQGKTLAELVTERGTIQVASAVFVVSEVCEALEHVHRAGVVHGGINPTDIIVNVSADGDVSSVKIIDFGYARVSSADVDTKRLVGTGEILGRAPYMSPEQCQGLKVDSRSDVYSLGCVMYEALTGQPPLKGDNFISTITKQISETALPIGADNPDLAIPGEIEAIVFKAIEKEPPRRYQTMSEMKDALRPKGLRTRKLKWWPW